MAVTDVNSGYLTDYARLKPSAQHRTLLAWNGLRAPPVRIFVRPVEIWRGGTRHDLPEQELAYVADALARAVRLNLAASFEIADRPGPGVFELRVALTHAGSDIRRHTKKGEPLGRRTGPLGLPTRNFVRVAALEAELLEPGTGRSAAMVMDRKAADEIPKGAPDSWEDVFHAFSLWGERLRTVFQSAGSL
ncbi:MAG TPA: DUF3313 family protein [Candidatus Binatia bacterium]|nr:DUF3313 family protein [Candidatus Binatia bacterium]